MNGRARGLLQAPAFPLRVTASDCGPSRSASRSAGRDRHLVSCAAPARALGASTCREGAPSLGREEESQAGSRPARPVPPPSWACGGAVGVGAAEASRLGLAALFHRQQPPHLRRWRTVTALLPLQTPCRLRSLVSCAIPLGWGPGCRASGVCVERRLSRGRQSKAADNPPAPNPGLSEACSEAGPGDPHAPFAVRRLQSHGGSGGGTLPWQWLPKGAATQSHVFTRRGAGALGRGLP